MAFQEDNQFSAVAKLPSEQMDHFGGSKDCRNARVAGITSSGLAELSSPFISLYLVVGRANDAVFARIANAPLKLAADDFGCWRHQ